MMSYRTIGAKTAMTAHLCGLVMGMATIIAMVPGMVQVMRMLHP